MHGENGFQILTVKPWNNKKINGHGSFYFVNSDKNLKEENFLTHS